MASTGHFSAATFRTAGAAATTHNLFTLENATGSGRVVRIKRLIVQLDATATLTAVMPLVKTSRSTAIPTGGTTLTKGLFDTTQTSVAGVVARGATASDGGGATAITATAGDIVWQQYAMRMHSLAGQVLAPDNSLLPALVENTPFILRPNQALLVQVVAAAGTSNPTSNQWFVECVWEEDDTV
jgi:hypothetical protein